MPTSASTEELLEQARSDLHRLVNRARFSTTPTARRSQAEKSLRDAINNALDLLKHHL